MRRYPREHSPPPPHPVAASVPIPPTVYLRHDSQQQLLKQRVEQLPVGCLALEHLEELPEPQLGAVLPEDHLQHLRHAVQYPPPGLLPRPPLLLLCSDGGRGCGFSPRPPAFLEPIQVVHEHGFGEHPGQRLLELLVQVLAVGEVHQLKGLLADNPAPVVQLKYLPGQQVDRLEDGVLPLVLVLLGRREPEEAGVAQAFDGGAQEVEDLLALPQGRVLEDVAEVDLEGLGVLLPVGRGGGERAEPLGGGGRELEFPVQGHKFGVEVLKFGERAADDPASLVLAGTGLRQLCLPLVARFGTVHSDGEPRVPRIVLGQDVHDLDVPLADGVEPLHRAGDVVLQLLDHPSQRCHVPLQRPPSQLQRLLQLEFTDRNGLQRPLLFAQLHPEVFQLLLVMVVPHSHPSSSLWGHSLCPAEQLPRRHELVVERAL